MTGDPPQPGPGSLDEALKLHGEGRADEAEAVYRRILEVDPSHKDALHLLGVLEAQRGKLEEARGLMEQALEADPEDARVHGNLGNVLLELEEDELALASHGRAADLAPGYLAARLGMANALRRLGRPMPAFMCLQRAMEIAPGNPSAYIGIADVLVALGEPEKALDVYQHARDGGFADAEVFREWGRLLRGLERSAEAVERFLQALALAPEGAATASRIHVEELFDGYAPEYERHAREALGYRAPELLRDLLAEHGPAGRRFERLLDLGCGTGFVGRELGERVHEAWGVDVSRGMLDQARAGGGYGRLVQADVVEFLEETEASFDLFVAADVLSYIGDLGPLFERIAERSLEGTCLLFSAELLEEGAHALQATGRFAHSRSYCEEVLRRTGFRVVSRVEAALRPRADESVRGQCVLAARAADDPGVTRGRAR